MQEIWPFLQTVLWVGLIGGIAIRFHNPIYDILVSLKNRIDAGGSFKAGPFELSGQVTPLSIEEQAKRISQEINNMLKGDSTVHGSAEIAATPEFRMTYFQAEDLALRAIQAEYRHPIQREVELFNGLHVDGLLKIGRSPYAIEVKFLPHPTKAPEILRNTLAAFEKKLRDNHIFGLHLIIALVFPTEESANKFASDVYKEAEFSFITVPLDIRCYALPDLQKRFGLLG